jgi:two-component system, OmpR family, KDP operon response regulator KdpE
MTSVRKKLVLVVDDQPKVLKFIEIDLKLRGFDVVTTVFSEKALEMVNTLKPDIMLLDMVLPGVDGFEILNKLREYSSLPVIAFSASPNNQELALHAGADDFINKPFAPEEMARRIQSLLK